MELEKKLKELREHYSNVEKLLDEGRFIDEKYLQGKSDGLLIAIRLLEEENIPLF